MATLGDFGQPVNWRPAALALPPFPTGASLCQPSPVSRPDRCKLRRIQRRLASPRNAPNRVILENLYVSENELPDMDGSLVTLLPPLSHGFGTGIVPGAQVAVDQIRRLIAAGISRHRVRA